MTADHVDVLKPRDYGEHRKDSLAQCLESSDGRVQDLAQHLSQALREVQGLRDEVAKRPALPIQFPAAERRKDQWETNKTDQHAVNAAAMLNLGIMRQRQLDAMWAAFEKAADDLDEAYWPGNAKEAVDSCR